MYAKYLDHLEEKLGEADFSGLKIGLDCANGATGVVAEGIFRELGAEVSVINNETQYGRKINENAGSTHIEGLRRLVLEKKLDFGAAFDGDGDRCLLIDSLGELVDGDQILAIITKYLGLKQLVATVMANQGLLNWGEKNGVEIITTDVGDQNVFREMQEKDIQLGGEQSGHIILPGEAMGDGILTALMITKIVKESGKTLSELASEMKKFPQALINLPVTKEQKQNFSERKGVAKEINGRFLIRPSGTEDIIRITVWGEDETKTQKYAEKLVEKIKEEL